MITTIPNDTKITRIQYHPRFSVICSIGKAPFHGVIDVSYSPDDKLLEFESFETWLFSLANQSMTIEDLCRLVFDELQNALDCKSLTVTVSAETTVHAPVSATIESL